MKSQILILRHGITEGNKNRWFYGHVDLPLLPEGVEALKRQKEEGLYPYVPQDALCFTTGLGRTAETFNIIFGDRDFEKVKDLREINFGICECKTFDELEDNEHFQAWMYDESGEYRIPEGESKREFAERVDRGFQYVLERHLDHDQAKRREMSDYDDAEFTKEKTASADEQTAMTVVVCHGGVIAQIMNNAFPGEKDSQWDWMPEPGSGYIIEVEDGSLKSATLLGDLIVY